MRAGASRAAAEQGFLLLEVMVAMFVLCVGLLATLAVFDDSNHLGSTTQRQQVATSVAEQAMEALRADSYASLALSSPLPSHTSDGNPSGDTSGNPSDPDYWVSGSNLLIPTTWSSETSSTLSGVSKTGEALVSGGSISPQTTSTVNGYTATVYQFVTWVNDQCKYLGVDLCPGSEDAKRVTVAVVLGGSGTGVGKPVWLSTVVADPDAGIDGL